MNTPPIVARFIGPRSEESDLLVQARTIHTAAVQVYRAARKEARARCAARLRALRKKAALHGYRDGLARAEQEISHVVRRLDSLYQATVEAANRSCLELALSIASDVLGEECAANHKALAHRIANAISQMLEIRELHVALNQQNVDQVTIVLNRLFPEMRLCCHADPEIAPGDAQLHGSFGSIALRWREQLVLIQRALTQSLTAKLEAVT